MITSKKNTLEYSWGDNCKGWHLLKTPSLGIIQEEMPPKTEEVKHKHIKSQQYFYMLKGQATFILEDSKVKLNPNEGIHVLPGKIHKILNETNETIEFLVISEPHSHGDREMDN